MYYVRNFYLKIAVGVSNLKIKRKSVISKSRISNNFWNSPKHTSVILICIAVQRSILSIDAEKNQLINSEKLKHYLYPEIASKQLSLIFYIKSHIKFISMKIYSSLRNGKTTYNTYVPNNYFTKLHKLISLFWFYTYFVFLYTWGYIKEQTI